MNPAIALESLKPITRELGEGRSEERLDLRRTP
jgi:hypothetical protein